MNYLHLISVPIMLILDFTFFFFSKKMFDAQILQVQNQPLKLNIMGAIACYFFLIFGLFFFIFKDKRSPMIAMILGFVIYGVFETTSYALLEKWKIQTVIMDILWGGILFYLTTYLTYAFTNYIQK
jgi:uncharacterized membrane protein